MDRKRPVFLRQDPPRPGAKKTPFLLRCLFGPVLCASLAAPVNAAPSLTIDASSGEVLYAQEATEPWYPASLTKLMTVYVALKAVREHRISLETPLWISPRSVRMPPSKMGFKPGTTITLGNALKILMVKSANDIAVTVAEGVSGSVEAFADEMNQAAFSLSLTQSHFVNPNGLPDPRHYSSARDMAILARALYLLYPDQAGLFDIGALQVGDQIIQNHNNLLGRYPGADGMKTGFTCPAGFNVVASATQNGHKYIVVVLGSPNVEKRTIKVAALFDRAFAGIDKPQGQLMAMPETSQRTLPDPHFDVCRNRKKVMLEANAELDRLLAPLTTQPDTSQPFFNTAAGMQSAVPMALRITLVPPPDFDPQKIFLGAAEGYTGPIAQPRPPHTPIGSEPPPPNMEAYAEPKTAPASVPGAPLAPDVAAIPLRLNPETAAATHEHIKDRHRHHGIAARTSHAAAIRQAKALLSKHAAAPAPVKAKPKPKTAQRGNTRSE